MGSMACAMPANAPKRTAAMADDEVHRLQRWSDASLI
jgi:hypothetical protein